MLLTEEDKELVRALCQEISEGKADLTFKQVGEKFDLQTHEVLEIWTGMKWDTRQQRHYA